MDVAALTEAGDAIARPLVVDCFIPGDPFPAARPRFDSRSKRTYMPTEYQTALGGLAWGLKAARPHKAPAGPLEVVLTFYRATRHAVDVDNLAKTVLDAAKGVLWTDDSQVFELRIRKVLGKGARAGTKITVRRI